MGLLARNQFRITQGHTIGCAYHRRDRLQAIWEFFCADIKKGLKSEAMPLVEIRVFGFGLLQNGDVRVRIFPERKEILIGGIRLGLITQ